MGTMYQKLPQIIPALLMLIEVVLIAFAFLADLLGYGNAGNFGMGQLFLMIAGGLHFF